MASLLACSAGCKDTKAAGLSDGGNGPFDLPDDERPQASTTTATTDLELLSEPSEALGFGERATLSVRLTDRDGAPIEDAPVSFALMGRAQDASLDNLEVVTDADGLADNDLLSGEVLATFRVRISAPGAEDLYVDIRISNAGFGTLLVDAPYDGARNVTKRNVSALAMMDCASAERMAGDPMKTLTPETGLGPAEFLALPAEVSYAVQAWAEGDDGTVLARGCLDGVRLGADDQVRVSVPFEDEPLSPGGEYATALMIDASEPGATLVRAMRDAAETTILGDASSLQTGQAEAGFLLDSMELALGGTQFADAAGIAEFLDNLRTARAAPGDPTLEQDLAAQLGFSGQGPRAAAMIFGERIAERLSDVELHAQLTLGADADAVWSLASWSLPDGDAGAVALTQDIADISDDVVMQASFALDRDVLEIERLSLPSRLGALSAEALRQTAATADGDPQEVRKLAGCDILASWLGTVTFYTDSCTSSCIEASCDRAIERIVSAGTQALLDLDTRRPTLSLEGELSLYDEDGDLRAEAMSGEALSGRWELADDAPDDAEPEALAATATARDTTDGEPESATGQP